MHIRAYDGDMRTYRTARREDEANSIVNSLTLTYRKFNIDISVTGVEYGPRTALLHCIAGGLDDIDRIEKLISSIEYALGRHNVMITPSTINQFAFDITVPFEGEPLYPEWKESAPLQSELSVPLGVTTSGEEVQFDFVTLRNVLMAGSTSSGKSMLIHSLLCSLIRMHTPEGLQLVHMDPKRVELTVYENLPHCMMPIILDSEPANKAFGQLKHEMDERLSADASTVVKLPKIVVFADEWSDFMRSEYAKSIEENVIALAEKGHTVGIHLILSTSRPSVDIYTNAIREAFSSRIVGCVASSADSITMLETSGAEKLLGKGDMLFSTPERKELIRFQGFAISHDDIREVIHAI